jgi:hypothetical protein
VDKEVFSDLQLLTRAFYLFLDFGFFIFIFWEENLFRAGASDLQLLLIRVGFFFGFLI